MQISAVCAVRDHGPYSQGVFTADKVAVEKQNGPIAASNICLAEAADQPAKVLTNKKICEFGLSSAHEFRFNRSSYANATRLPLRMATEMLGKDFLFFADAQRVNQSRHFTLTPDERTCDRTGHPYVHVTPVALNERTKTCAESRPPHAERVCRCYLYALLQHALQGAES